MADVVSEPTFVFSTMYYWAIHENGGPAHIAEAAVVVDHKVYSLGNYESRTGKASVDVCVFNTVNHTWSYPPERRSARNHDLDAPSHLDGYSTVVYEDKIFIWGGLMDGSACDSLFCFDTSTLAWSRPEVTGNLPSSRIRHAACVIDHIMYVYGGLDASNACISMEVTALDLHTMEWKRVRAEGDPPCVEFPTAAAVGTKMYIFSECEDNGFQGHDCPGLMYLDTTTATWYRTRTTGNVPSGLYDYIMFAQGQYLCLFIGTFDAQGVGFRELYRLNTLTDDWEIIRTLGFPPNPGHGKLLVVVGDLMFCFGGLKMPAAFTSSYAGKLSMYDDDMHVLHFAPTLRTLSVQAVLRHRLDVSSLPASLKWELGGVASAGSTRSVL